MMNTENALLSRSGGTVVKNNPDAVAMIPGALIGGCSFNDAAMLQRNDGLIPAQVDPELSTSDEKEIYNPDIVPEQVAPSPVKPVSVPAQSAPKSAPAQPADPKPKQQPPQKPKQASALTKPIGPPSAITSKFSPDKLCQAYTAMFKESLGLDLSTAICFENMRRMCEVDIKDPAGTLYFLENTYRVSTLIYLASNLPILFVTSVLADKNRKNILKYVTIEVENGSKPYAELLDLRRRRWARKFENMAVNDAMTVTPGATMLSPDLSQKLMSELANISVQLRPFNNEMTGMVAKFDDSARNDIIYIYSNWWYLLQGFENVPEMRSYIMAVTDDTRKNLKI